SEQVTCRQQQVFFAVVLQFGAAVLGEDNGVAFGNSHWVSSPLSFARPGPTAITVASCGFSFAESGITRPDAVVVSASTIWTSTLSSSGLMFAMVMIPPCEILKLRLCRLHQ